MLLVLCVSGCAAMSVPITGSGVQGTTQQFDQSGPALSVSNFWGRSMIAATYNDATDSGSTILYSSSTRTVLKGASLLGWSYSGDGGRSWIYGGKAPPPDGWPVLWGDPAITHSEFNQRYVFISNLAMPSKKFPATGVSGYVGPYLGGACIVRSTDAGMTFQHYQCIHNNYDFYDGGSMAAGPGREIYAAYVDVASSQVDVWMSPTESGTFNRLPNPFPSQEMWSHPRLRVDGLSGALYVAAQRQNGDILINRYANGAWHTPVVAGTAELYPQVNLSDRSLRTGPQFSFDVGAVSQHENDAVRFLYTTRDSAAGRLYVRGSFCPRDLTPGCYDAPEWGTLPVAGDQFNPNVRAFPGIVGLSPVWKASYLSRQDDPRGNTVSVQHGNLAVLPNGTRTFLPSVLVGSHLVCPDARGYWSGYDDMQLSGFSDAGAAQFIRTFADSSQGCERRWEYTSHHVHVSAVVSQ